MSQCLRALLLLAASIAGCKREAPPPPSPPSSGPVSSSSIPQQVAEALKRLAAVRGLDVKQPIQTRVVAAPEYRRQLVQRTATLLSADDTHLSSLWTSLNFADSSVTALGVAERVVDEKQSDAFYDSVEGALVVREPTAPSYDAREDVAVIMALERALQEQHFGRATAGIGLDVDRNLARYALREGDAAAASFAYFATRAGKPIVESVSRAAALIDSLPVDALITGVGYAPALGAAPLIVRDELSRARPAGLQLVAALLRAKGFDLVNRALANPPTSMLAVYDPSLYAHGWQPMSFPEIAGVPQRGALGVVGLLAFIERCQPTDRAKQFVADWRGDALSLDARSPSVVWRTAWKDDVSARRFADEVTGAAQCRAPGTSAAVHFEAAQHGNVVALTNSADAKLLTSAAALGARPAPPSASPLGDANIALTAGVGPHYAGRPTLEVRNSGKLSGRHYANERLGFTAEIPAGFEAVTDEILAVDHPPPSLASGRVAFEQTAAPFNSQQDFFSGFKDRVSRTFFRGAPLSEVAAGQEQTAFGTAPYRVYEMRNGHPATVRVVALPICSGAAALIASMVYMDEPGASALGGWLSSFHATPKPAPICAVLSATAP